MILAAGLGTRMAPLTADRPKPVLPVLDEPLVARLVRGLARCGVERAVVNAHVFPEQIRSALDKAPIPVEVSVEPELLGSGGGIRAARRHLDGPEPFVVVNGDMCVELDLAPVLAAHTASGALATLVLRDEVRKHEFGTIGYAANAKVCRITDRVDRASELGPEVGSGLFAGIHVLTPEVFDLMPRRDHFDIVADVYVPLLAEGGCLGAWLQPTSAGWWPVGTPRELLGANLLALTHEGPALSDEAIIEGELRPPVFVGHGACVERGAIAGPRAVLGAGSVLRAEARDSVLLPGATPPAGVALERAIAYGAEVWRDA